MYWLKCSIQLMDRYSRRLWVEDNARLCTYRIYLFPVYWFICLYNLLLWTKGKQKRGGICNVIYIETFFDTVFIGSPIAAACTCSIINISEVFCRMYEISARAAYIIIIIIIRYYVQLCCVLCRPRTSSAR